MDSASDKRILADLAEGKLCAFEEIVLSHQHRLYAFCLRILGNTADAEEVAQDAFIRAFRALTRDYTPDQIRTLALRAWLHRIAVNLVRNRLRVQQPAVVPLFGDQIDDESQQVCPAASERDEPEYRAVKGETLEELAEAILALPERYRAAIVLRHVQGFSYADSADILGIPIGTVKSDVHRGLALLRRSLRKEVMA